MKKIDWELPVCTKHVPPLIGDVMHELTHSGKRMVQMPSLSQRLDLAVKSPPTWHYDEFGSCHVLGEPNEHDLVNFDPSDGIERLRLVRER